LPDSYALGLCRIEPENNVHVILQALDGHDMPLVFVGNWDNSAYGRDLKERYSERPNLFLLDPIYEPDALFRLRSRACVYLHGHSAGGTNPSLVEMMHFGIPILAYSCQYNRCSTEEKALFFQSAAELSEKLYNLDSKNIFEIGDNMREIAQRKYTWENIGKAYFELLDHA
jgi:glycosyltransferase involved in cell wall biosynthesis